MAGHSHWKQIKSEKGAADQKRGELFSKLLASIVVAARTESNPQFNPTLRAAILKAKENQVPQENIERAIQRAKSKDQNLEEMIVEAYGPGGAAILIEAVTDNNSRTITELKLIFKKFGTKLALPGSVRWAFNRGDSNEWKPKFTQQIGKEDKNKLQELTQAIENQNDVQKVYTNAI